MRKKAAKKPQLVPSDHEGAGFILAWLLSRADDRQVRLLLKMDLRDWIDWIESKAKAKRLNKGKA